MQQKRAAATLKSMQTFSTYVKKSHMTLQPPVAGGWMFKEQN